MPGAIDIVINLHTPEVLPLKPKWRKDFIGGKIGADAEILERSYDREIHRAHGPRRDPDGIHCRVSIRE